MYFFYKFQKFIHFLFPCKFCFAKHSCERELGLEEWIQIIDPLVENGCKKINVAGGEPTLISFLPELLNHIHQKGIFTSIISNGTNLSNSLLEKIRKDVDLIGLSIDSGNPKTEQILGRGTQSNHVQLIKNRAKKINELKIPLKINSVICALNWNEDMHSLIQELKPIRWKVFQCYLIQGVNEPFFKQYGKLSNNHFRYFTENHKDLHPIAESNDLMENSYCMISPSGRFYQNSNHEHQYSDLLLNLGVKKSMIQIQYCEGKYKERNGNYFKKIQST